MKELVRENSINKEWISIGGLTDVVVSMLDSMFKEALKIKLFITLKDIIEGHARNKDIFVENQGIEKLVPCLGLNSTISKAAAELLYEVLQERSGWNVPYCRILSQQCNAILFLVSLLKSPIRALAEKSEEILTKLCDEDENVIQCAKVNCFTPLIDRVIHG
ncbi:U-box domain-containing protein 43-like [Forsythia ovata]|uniref:U-box domain-containing protein 43-like n=1 Tax=Forsythia ovata TaxID=205694 RepID=A0ABD1UZ80_9LAMI